MFQDINISNGLNRDLKEAIPTTGFLDAVNIIQDNAGRPSKRPGLFLSENLDANGSQGIDGLYYWEAKGMVLAVHGENLYHANDLTQPFTKANDTQQLTLGPCTFASNRYWVLISTSSGRMMKWNGTDEAVLEESPIAPTNVSHVTYLNGKFLANQLDSDNVWYTEPTSDTDPTSAPLWSGYFSAERSGEHVLALATYNNQILVLKRSSMEFFFDDGVAPFRRVEGTARSVGIGAVKSLIVEADVCFWLDQFNQAIMLTGNQPNVISASVRAIMRNMVKYTDALAFSVDRYVVFTYPTIDKTYVYDVMTRRWYEWSTWHLASGSPHRWVGQAGCLNYQGIPMVGGNNGSIYFLSPTAYSDYTDSIRVMIRLNHQSHGIVGYKRCNEARFILTTEDEPSANDGNLNVFTRFFNEPSVPNPDAATRCSAYTYLFQSLPTGYTVFDVVGLPSGLSFSQSTQQITGTALCVSGEFPISVVVQDSYGQKRAFKRTFTIADFTPTITVT